MVGRCAPEPSPSAAGLSGKKEWRGKSPLLPAGGKRPDLRRGSGSRKGGVRRCCRRSLTHRDPLTLAPAAPPLAASSERRHSPLPAGAGLSGEIFGLDACPATPEVLREASGCRDPSIRAGHASQRDPLRSAAGRTRSPADRQERRAPRRRRLRQALLLLRPLPEDSFRKRYRQPARRLSEAGFRIAKRSIRKPYHAGRRESPSPEPTVPLPRDHRRARRVAKNRKSRCRTPDDHGSRSGVTSLTYATMKVWKSPLPASRIETYSPTTKACVPRR